MNKCVFVSGGTKNSGLGIVRKFASEGYDVFIGSRSLEESEQAAELVKKEYGVFAKGYKTKVFDEDDVKRIMADIEAQGYLLDCVVLCAANLGIKQQLFEVSIEDFMDVINTNIGWNFMIIREAAKQMIKKGKGSIVFINSNTSYRAIPDRISYCTSKSGALGMMRALAVDLGKYNIRVNAVLPGMIKTDRWENNYNDCKNALSNYTPLGDIADFEDVANATFYFGSELSKNCTGSELCVDGGNMIQLYPQIPENK